MSQERKNSIPKPVATNVPVDKNRIDVNAFNTQEQQQLLQQLEKELKAETPVEAAPLLEFVLKHVREIALVIIVCILAISAWGIWQWRAESAITNARTEFTRILNTQDPAQKLALLNTFSANMQQQLEVAVFFEQATAADALKQYDIAVDNYKKIIAKEQNSPLGITVQFCLSDILLRAGKPVDSLAVMEAFLVSAPDRLKNTTLEQVAMLAEIAGNKNRALQAYRELAASTNPEIMVTRTYYLDRIASLSE